MDGTGGTCGTERLTGYENYPIAGVSPLVLNNELIDQGCKLFVVFRD